MNLSPFRYAGAKNKLLPILEPYLNTIISNSYAEPFVGGGSVALFIAQKYPNVKLILNDKDEWVSSFWSVVSKDISELLSLIDIKPTIDRFYELSEAEPTSPTDKAYRCLFFNRTCFSGIVKRNGNKVTSSPIGGKYQKSRYTVDCRFNTDKLKKKIIEINKLLFNRVEVYNLDFKDFISNNDFPLYLDPPYYVKGDMLYNETMSKIDHLELGSLLSNKQNWVLSYDDCSEIREIYKNCQIVQINALYSINGKKDNWSKKQELIIHK